MYHLLSEGGEFFAVPSFSRTGSLLLYRTQSIRRREHSIIKQGPNNDDRKQMLIRYHALDPQTSQEPGLRQQ